MAHTLPAGQFPGFTSSEVVIVKINVDDVVGDVAVKDVGETVEEDAGEIVVDDVDILTDVVLDDVSMLGVSVVDARLTQLVSCVPWETHCIQSRLAVTLANTSG